MANISGSNTTVCQFIYFFIFCNSYFTQFIILAEESASYRPKFKISASPRISAPSPTLFYGRVLRQQRLFRFGHLQSQASDYRLIQTLRIDHRNDMVVKMC